MAALATKGPERQPKYGAGRAKEEEVVEEEKKKGVFGRVAPVATVACLMPFSARWVVPVILSEITRQSGRRV